MRLSAYCRHSRRYGVALMLFTAQILTSWGLYAQVIPVEIISHEDGRFELLRGGEPYFIHGAGGSDPARFEELARRGGNSVRTWGVDAQTRNLLNEAHAQGLSVMLGLWVGRETDGFNYNDPVAIENQLRRFRTFVRNYKDHPALLAWGVGNEVEVRYTNHKVWDAINDIAAMIHEEDGNHPTVAVTAHISVSLANLIAERAPNIDILGVNAYAGIGSVAQRIRESNWNKPYIIAEWGVNGPWEVGKTSWGAPLEPNSSQKAALITERYHQHILGNTGHVLGSYAFLWGSKYEGTHTWFGLYVGHETTEMVDALQKLWKGDEARNRAPAVQSLTINNIHASNSLVITSASHNTIECLATDPDGDPLYYEFIVLPESGNQGVVASPGSTLDHIPGLVSSQDGHRANLKFGQEHNLREFRLYAFVRDRRGHVGTASFPFRTNFTTVDVPHVQQDDAIRLHVYPNPSLSLLTLRLPDVMETEWLLTITAMDGRIVLRETLSAGQVDVNVPLQGIPSGIYRITLYGKSTQLTLSTSFVRS